MVNGRRIGGHERPTAILLFSPALGMAHNEYFGGLMEGQADPAPTLPWSSWAALSADPRDPGGGGLDRPGSGRASLLRGGQAGVLCSLHVYPKVGHLLTRNLEVQYKDFDGDPADAADARRKEDAFLAGLGYLRP